jgi:hypothetical protein
MQLRMFALPGAVRARYAVFVEFLHHDLNRIGKLIFSGGSTRRVVVTLALCSLLIGCAEFTHRGGFVAEIEDKVLFVASAKSHRVLRSYVVAASLITIANNRGIPSGDKIAFLGRVVQLLSVTREAFTCAYQSRSGCVFFDEKMARLDYNIFKLAMLVLVNSETTELISQLEKQIVPSVPVLGPTVDASVTAIKAAGQVALAASQTSEVVDNLVKLGYNTANTLAPLFPLYRDAQELDMVVILDMLARRCVFAQNLNLNIKAGDKNSPLRNRLDDRLSNQEAVEMPCKDFKYGMGEYADGNGDLSNWNSFTKTMSINYIQYVTPTDQHFLQVSGLIASSCDQIFGQMGTTGVGGKDSGNSDVKITAVDTNVGCSNLVLFSDRVKAYRQKDLEGIAEKSATNLRTQLDGAQVEAPQAPVSAPAQKK